MKSFIVKENRFGTRRLACEDESLFSLILSELNEDVICFSDYNNHLLLSWSDYFTKNGDILRGRLSIDYEIKNPIDYSYELLTESVLDVMCRTVLSSYFRYLDVNENDENITISSEDKEKLVKVINHSIKNYLPFIKVNNIKDMEVKKSAEEYKNSGLYLIKKQDIENKTDKSFKPIIHFYEDNIFSYRTRYYPNEIYIGKNEVLYYRGDIKGPGKYYNKDAKGSIIASGKHVYSPNCECYENGNIKYDVYPNFIFTVYDIVKYLENYDYVRNILNNLSRLIIQYTYNDKDCITYFDDIYKLNNDYINKIILKLEEYGISLDCVTYTIKNPYIKNSSRTRNKEGFDIIKL